MFQTKTIIPEEVWTKHGSQELILGINVNSDWDKGKVKGMKLATRFQQESRNAYLYIHVFTQMNLQWWIDYKSTVSSVVYISSAAQMQNLH